MAKSAKTVSFVRDLKTRRIWKVASPFEWKLLNYTFILLTTALTDCSSSSSSESSRGLTSVSSVMGDQKGRLTGALTSKRQPFATTYTTHVQTNKHWRSKKAMRNRLRFASLQWNLYFMQKSGEGGCDTRETTPLKRQRAPSVRRCGMCLGVVSTVMTTRTHARPQTKEEEDEGKKNVVLCVRRHRRRWCTASFFVGVAERSDGGGRAIMRRASSSGRRAAEGTASVVASTYHIITPSFRAADWSTAKPLPCESRVFLSRPTAPPTTQNSLSPSLSIIAHPP